MLVSIAIALNRHCRPAVVQRQHVIIRQTDGQRGDVLLEPLESSGAEQRHDPRFLSEKPSKRDLRRGCSVTVADFAKETDETLIGATSLARKAGDCASDITFIECRAGVDRAGEKALAERAERNQAYAKLLKRRNDLVFGLSRP